MNLAALFRCDDPQLLNDKVARTADGAAITRRDLLHRVARIARVLPPARAGSQIALAFGHDRLGFTAALLAAWRCGHAVAIAENTRRERILPVLQHPDTLAMLHDTDSGRAHQVKHLLAGYDATIADAATEIDHAPWLRRDGDPVLACATIGPDGGERWLTCTAAELLRRLDRLASILPLAGDERVVSSFTPGFPPALFSACLLPLFRGTALDLDRPPDAEALAARSHEPTTRVLLCSAASIDELTRLPATALRPDCAVACPEPLPPSLRDRVSFVVQPLAVDAGAAADAVDHAPGIDALRRLEGIDDVAALAVPADEATVLVALAGHGAAAVAAAPPSSRTTAAGMRLGAFATLPRDVNGQLMPAETFLAFGLGRHGQPVTTELSWSHQPSDDGSACRRTRIPDDYRFFEGHFTGYPVTAGAVQLHELVLPCLRSLCGGQLPALQQLDGIKFLARFGPGDTVDVVLRRDADPCRIVFEIRRGESRCTAGRASFAAALPDLGVADEPR